MCIYPYGKLKGLIKPYISRFQTRNAPPPYNNTSHNILCIERVSHSGAFRLYIPVFFRTFGAFPLFVIFNPSGFRTIQHPLYIDSSHFRPGLLARGACACVCGKSRKSYGDFCQSRTEKHGFLSQKSKRLRLRLSLLEVPRESVCRPFYCTFRRVRRVKLAVVKHPL